MSESRFPDPNVIKSGHLAVGDGHKLYFEDWGNPQGAPIIHLHGGPVGGFSDSHKLIYDPNRLRVIFYDQRCCDKSTPFKQTENNTAQNSIADIEKLIKFFDLTKVSLAGGS